jgi:hypothetical protein
MGWTTELGAAWHYGVLGLTVLLAVLASGHALLFKRDSRAAAMWVGFVWFAPLVGPVLYFVLGVNRLRRRAVLLRRDAMHRRVDAGGGGWKVRDLEGDLVPEVRHLTGLGGYWTVWCRVRLWRAIGWKCWWMGMRHIRRCGRRFGQRSGPWRCRLTSLIVTRRGWRLRRC